MYVHLCFITWYFLFFIVILYAESNVSCYYIDFQAALLFFLLCIYNVAMIDSLNNCETVFLYAF